MSWAPSASIVEASNCVIDDGTSVSIAPAPRPRTCITSTPAGRLRSAGVASAARARRPSARRLALARARSLGLRDPDAASAILLFRCARAHATPRSTRDQRCATDRASRDRERRRRGGANRIGRRASELSRVSTSSKRGSSPMRTAASNRKRAYERAIRPRSLLAPRAARWSNLSRCARNPCRIGSRAMRRASRRGRCSAAPRWLCALASRRSGAAAESRATNRSAGRRRSRFLRRARTEGRGIGLDERPVLGPPLDPFDAEQDASRDGNGCLRRSGVSPGTVRLHARQCAVRDVAPEPDPDPARRRGQRHVGGAARRGSLELMTPSLFDGLAAPAAVRAR